MEGANVMLEAHPASLPEGGEEQGSRVFACNHLFRNHSRIIHTISQG